MSAATLAANNQAARCICGQLVLRALEAEAHQIDTGSLARGIHPLADGGKGIKGHGPSDALNILARGKGSGLTHCGRGMVQVHISSRNPVARGGCYAGVACCRMAGVSVHRSAGSPGEASAKANKDTRGLHPSDGPRGARSRARAPTRREVFPHRSTSDTTRSTGISVGAPQSMMRMFA